jgi:hypothetical protein
MNPGLPTATKYCEIEREVRFDAINKCGSDGKLFEAL